MSRKYRLLTGEDSSTFCQKVSTALADGWQLHGSPTIAFNPARDVMICAQAVIKDSSSKNFGN